MVDAELFLYIENILARVYCYINVFSPINILVSEDLLQLLPMLGHKPSGALFGNHLDYCF